ncbi:MAG: HAD-IA family hydrolase [Armatimonadota bacterium]|nr:HAD-IA family hydrolase [Armatimonadota bacterium]
MNNLCSYDAIVFDLFDTLYPWGPDKYSKALNALCDTVASHCPSSNAEDIHARYMDIRVRMSAENLSRLVENDFTFAIRELVGCFTDKDNEEIVAKSIHNYDSALAGALTLPDGVSDLLRRLSANYKLGVLSNYPTAGGIRMALERDDLTPMLAAIVVSSEVGFIKPHPAMFQTVCDKLDCDPGKILFVGDTWESDVVGACLAGMPCVRITPSQSGIEQGQFFNGHIRKWLESQANLEWKKAQPLVELMSVLRLEDWLS